MQSKNGQLNQQENEISILNSIQKELLKKLINNLNISESHFNDILNYLEVLIRNNEKLNLFSRKMNIETLITDHIMDCLAGWEYFKNYSSITDLGSGGGMPGILLGIIFPDKKFTLIEKSVKKSLFLNETIKTLGLKNTILINDVVASKHIKSDAVTCRAFKSIIEILEMTKDYFNNNGIYVLYKATIQKINDEINEAKKRFVFDVKINKIDLIKEKERHIVIIKKTN